MGSITVVTSAASPVSLTEAKRHLNICSSDDDSLILSQASAATRWAESYCNRHFGYNVLRYDFNGATPVSSFSLPRGPVEIESVVYDDVDGNEQTWDASNYELDAYQGCLVLAYGGTWPAARSHWNSMRVTYSVGEYTGSPAYDNTPEDVKAGILLVLGDLYENRERQQDIQLYGNDAAEMLLNSHRLFES